MIALHGRSSAKLVLAAHLDSFFSVWEVAQMSQSTLSDRNLKAKLRD